MWYFMYKKKKQIYTNRLLVVLSENALRDSHIHLFDVLSKTHLFCELFWLHAITRASFYDIPSLKVDTYMPNYILHSRCTRTSWFHFNSIILYIFYTIFLHLFYFIYYQFLLHIHIICFFWNLRDWFSVWHHDVLK